MNFNDIVAALPTSISELLFKKLDTCNLSGELSKQAVRTQLEIIVSEVQNEMQVDPAVSGMVRMLLSQVPQAALNTLFI